MKRIVIAVTLSICSLIAIQAARIEGFKSDNPATTPLTIIVDAVDYRSDLTRIYARLVGMPHTSNRVDAVTLIINGHPLQATDIDGIDFKRYFQWEDTPHVAIEIDFPAIKKPSKKFELKTLTPRGEAHTRVTKK